MKFVFVGTGGGGRSTLINRVLGTNILPIGGTDVTVTRSMITIHNVLRSGYKVTVRLIPANEVDIKSFGYRSTRILIDECVKRQMLDERYDVADVAERIPWQQMYDAASSAAMRISRTEYIYDDDLQVDLLQLLCSAAYAVFIEEIVIEGNFPNLNRDDMIVDMPYRGYTERTDAQLHRELASDAVVFCVLDGRQTSYRNTLTESRAIRTLLGPGKTYHICYTHSVTFLRDRTMRNPDGSARPPGEVYPTALAKEQLGWLDSRGRVTTVRFFENSDEPGLDKHMLEELIGFIRNGV